MFTRKGMIPALLTALALGSTSFAADARQLNYASGYPPGSIGVKAAELFADAVEEYSGGSLTARVYPLSLLNFAEASSGVRDGIADGAFVLLPYFPNEYPYSNMLSEVSLALELSDDPAEGLEGFAFTGAFSEFIFNHCPECVDEFKRQNQVFLGGSASTAYQGLCRTGISSLSDLRGKRLRAGGAQWARWTENFGASAVSMSINEVYEGLSQGVLDCVLAAPTELTGFQLMGVVTDITLGVPGGVFGGSSPSTFNRDTWLSLSEDDRRALLRAGTVMSSQLSYLYAEENRKNLKDAEEKGIRIHQADAELMEASRAFIQEDLDNIAARYSQRHGIGNAEEMIGEFRTILDRWIDLVADVNGPDELADLYWEEVVSKVDVSSYGQ